MGPKTMAPAGSASEPIMLGTIRAEATPGDLAAAWSEAMPPRTEPAIMATPIGM